MAEGVHKLELCEKNVHVRVETNKKVSNWIKALDKRWRTYVDLKISRAPRS